MDFETVFAHQRLRTQQQNVGALRHIQGLGVAASAIKASAEWKVLADHYESLKQSFEGKRKSYESKLVGGATLPHDEYVELKRQLAIATASERAWDMAIKLVDVLLSNGEEAMKSLTKSEPSVIT